MKDILSNDWLDDFFQPIDNGILNRRESSTIEFKTDFEWSIKEKKAAYAKTIAAFANTKGGYLIFGIGKKPHKVEGCQNFERVDIAEITDYLQSCFHCEIIVQKSTYIIGERTIGILAVNESTDKPVICIKNQQNSKNEFILREGIIYYRYSGKSCDIRSGDLINLINSAKELINQKWISALSKISSVGISNIGVLDTQSGLLKINDSKFLLDERLLKDLRVVDKYSEKIDGEPAVKIIGNIEDSARIINRNKTIEEFEIIQEYLERSRNYDYGSILERIPNLGSYTYPFNYFLQSVNKTIDHYTIDLLSKPKFNDQTPFIHKMLKRHSEWLDRRKKQVPISERGRIAKKRLKYYTDLKVKQAHSIIDKDNVKDGDIKAFCEAILHVDSEHFDLIYIRSIVLKIFKKHYSKTDIAKSIREACCSIDILEYGLYSI
jgi:hypothetical protein